MSVKLVAVRKDDAGMITHFLTDDGSVLTFEQARDLVRGNEVDSLTEIQKDGSWEIDIATTQTAGSNLDNLPSF